MTHQHGQQVAPLDFFTVNGAHREGIKGTNELMKAALVIANRPRITAIPVSPGPVRDPAHDRRVTMEWTAMDGIAGAKQIGQTVGRRQKNQAATVQQGVGFQAAFTEAMRNVLEARGSRQDNCLLTNLKTCDRELKNFIKAVFFPHY